MPTRRQERKVILDILYQKEIGKESLEEAIKRYTLSFGEDKLTLFVMRMVSGITEKQHEIDEIISGYARDWTLKRMPILDKNILRIGTYELLYEDEIPLSVSINEAVELAKKYSTESSSRFVNGILGNVVNMIKKK